jgi:hypothetical protein
MQHASGDNENDAKRKEYLTHIDDRISRFENG